VLYDANLRRFRFRRQCGERRERRVFVEVVANEQFVARRQVPQRLSAELADDSRSLKTGTTTL
jgi:hypothetical protein